MSHNLEARQLEELRATMSTRASQLREEIRQTLLKSDQEQYAMIADQVRDLEDDSFADLMVDVNLAEIDRDLEELRLIDTAMRRLGDGSYGHCEALRLADRTGPPARRAVREPLLRLPERLRTHALPQHRAHALRQAGAAPAREQIRHA